MRYELIIFLIVLIVITIVMLYKIRIVSAGYWFCELSKEFVLLLQKVKEIQKNEEMKEISQVVRSTSIKIDYSPEKPELLYYQYEVIISRIEKLYRIIENKEKHFRVSDWREVERAYDKFKEHVYHIRFEEWKYGYKKVI